MFFIHIIGTGLETYALLYIFAVDHQASPLCIQEKFLFSEATMKIIIRRDLELFRLRQLLLAFEVLVLLSVIMIVYSNFEGQPPLLISKLFDNDINPCQLHLTNSIIKNYK